MGRVAAVRLAFVAAPLVVAGLTVGTHGCGKARTIDEGPNVSVSDLNLEIVSVQLPGPGVDAPRVTFRATDRTGAPVDVLAELGRAASRTLPYVSNGPRFTLAQVEADGSNTNWYEAVAAPAAFTPPEGITPPTPAPSPQPGFQQAPAANPGSRITANGDGTFTFAFTEPTTDAARRSAEKPIVAAMWMERVTQRATGGSKRWPAAATRTSGAGGAPVAPHAAVSDAACSTCHVVMRAHDRRESVQLCRACHSGGTGVTYRDPESGENLDFRVMIHRIHAGADLPSVRDGGAFFIVGRNQAVFDFSEGEFPPLRKATDCTACHTGGANADAWKTNASFLACNACHDNLRYDGSAGTVCRLGADDVAPCDHVLSPATVNASSSCAQCHTAGASSPPIGPDVVHRNHLLDLAGTWAFEILGVTVGDDRKPVVRFRVLNAGAPIDIKNDPRWTQGAASRLFVDLAWPVTEFTNEGAGYVDRTVTSPEFPGGVPGQGLPVQVNALTTATPVSGESNVWEVVSPVAVPPQFSSFRVVLEGHPAEGTGTTALRVPVANAVRDVAIGGGTAARRRIVSAESCNACHAMISAHGANRNATPDACVVCHNPRATDFVRVVQAQNRATGPIADAAEEPIDFKILIHQIHAADIRRTPVTIYGFGGNPAEFPAAFPGQTGRCTICHVDDSYRLPLAGEALEPTLAVGDPTVHGDAAERRAAGKTTAVCASCHDMVRYDASAERPACNTLVPVNSAECSHSGGPQADEARCATCHGAGQPFDMARVHPISEKPQ